MYAIKGRLKVALLVIGFLAVDLGMYGGFQVQDAEAHTPSCDVTIPTFVLNAIRSIGLTQRSNEGHETPPPITATYSHRTQTTYSHLQRVVNGRKTAGYTCNYCGGAAYISEVLRRTEYWKHETTDHVFSAASLGRNLGSEFCHQHDTMTDAVQMWEIAGKNCYNVDCGG